MLSKCQLFWEIYELGIPVVVGPSLLAQILGCPTDCSCDVVIHVSDLERVDKRRCVWTTHDFSLMHRHIWIGGLPHVSIEDLEKIQNREISEVINCILERLRSGARVL